MDAEANAFPQDLFEEVASYVTRTPVHTLDALSPLVSYSGVLTFAFAGFPAAAENLKRNLNQISRLTRENQGSTWAKTTLGALKVGANLSCEDYLAMIQFFQQFRVEHSYRSMHVVRNMSLVLLGRRDLQEVVTSYTHQLTLPVDTNPPSTDMINRTQSVFAEALDDPQRYWQERLSVIDRDCFHYFRDDLPLEWSLVHFLGQESPFVPLLKDFRSAFRTQLPQIFDRFHWFEDHCLHVTYRSMNMVNG
jgi:hypothetical protein